MHNRLPRPLMTLFLAATVYVSNPVLGQTTPSGSAESPTLTYHSNVSEVRLVFFVTDAHNRPVQGLQKDDFAVVDDERVIREFRSFTHADLIKLDVIILMDSSESVLPYFDQELAKVHQLVSQSPWSPEDKLSVLSFSGMGAQFVCPGDCRSSFAADRVASLPRGGATPLFDAVDLAAKILIQRRHPDVWPVIILFSDGNDTISQASFSDVRRKILASEAQVYAVDLSPPGRPSNGTATLQTIADDSGGRRIFLDAGVLGIFNAVIDDLHSARVVTYALPESGSGFHSIRILPTHNLKLQFRCRRGYYDRSDTSHLEDSP
jgi:VWFA-related protein